MRIAIFGAGAIGCYCGGVLAAHGYDVRFIGRARIAEEVAAHGLHLTDLDGRDERVVQPDFQTDAAALGDADCIIITVKSGANDAAAQAIRDHARAGALVLSFQNGIDTAARLRDALPGRDVLAAMVPWNVAHLGEGHFHRGTEGVLMIEAHARVQPVIDAFRHAGIATEARADMPAVLWSKLLMNLNNAVNALSGLPLLEQLSIRDYRLVLAATIQEALALLKQAGIAPARIGKRSPKSLPLLLRLPDFLYRPMMRASLRIDAQARSSMQDDLRAGRKTEIDSLNGAVVALAAQLGRSAPLNARMTGLVHQAEQRPFASHAPARLKAALGARD